MKMTIVNFENQVLTSKIISIMKKSYISILIKGIAIILLFILVLPLSAQDTVRTRPQPRPAFRMPVRIISPELLPDNKVTFRVYSKEAEKVTVSGEWQAGFGASEELVKNDTGMFSLGVQCERHLDP